MKGNREVVKNWGAKKEEKPGVNVPPFYTTCSSHTIQNTNQSADILKERDLSVSSHLEEGALQEVRGRAKSLPGEV